MNEFKLITASWCGTCRPVKEYIEDNNLNVEILDVDKDHNIVGEFGIRGIPVLVTPTGQLVTTIPAIMNKLKEVYGSSSNA